MYYRGFAWLPLLVLICTATSAQSVVDRGTASVVVQREGMKLLRDSRVRALSLGLYLDGELLTQHFGELNAGQRDAPTDASVYDIASVTKTMLGYLVAAAVENGQVQLDDDVRDYLPAPYPNLAFNGEPVRIRHLLTHTAGLPGMLPLAWNGVFESLESNVPERFAGLQRRLGKADFWSDLATVSLSEPPGTRYTYSSAGCEILAYVLEQVTGQSLADQLRENLWGPAGMSTAALLPTDTAFLVRGYWMDNAKPAAYAASPLWGGGSGVTATLPDLLRYAALQLETEDPVVSRSHEILYTGDGRRIAYLWNVREDRYGRYFEHHGGSAGIQNWLFVLPRYDLAISVIVNHSGPKTPRKLSRLVQRVLKGIVSE